MKGVFLSICVLLFVQLEQSVSQTIRCESIAGETWGGSIENIRTCFMKYTTTIDTDAVSVSPPDSTVLGLDFLENKKISSLPIKLDETFPNLEGYDAGRCSLKTVSKINFKNLKQLKELYMNYNQIETINGDTFADLTTLKWLDLSHNNIKQMNGAAFGKLNKLIEVWLNGNICIDKQYEGATAIANTLVKDVNVKCAFAEPETSLSPTDETTNRIESTKKDRELVNEGSTMKTLAHWNLIFMMIFMRLLA